MVPLEIDDLLPELLLFVAELVVVHDVARRREAEIGDRKDRHTDDEGDEGQLREPGQS